MLNSDSKYDLDAYDPLEEQNEDHDHHQDRKIPQRVIACTLIIDRLRNEYCDLGTSVFSVEEEEEEEEEVVDVVEEDEDDFEVFERENIV